MENKQTKTEQSDTSLKERIRSIKEWDRSTKFYTVAFCAVATFAAILGVMWMNNQSIFYEWIIRYFVKPIGGLRTVGWIIFLIFMLLQSILMPIPSEVVLLGAGAIWGLWLGFILGMIGSMLSAMMAYTIAYKGGAPMVEKFLGRDNVEIVDVYLQKYGAWVIFVMRAIPFIGFDPVSYVSGLLKIDTKKYFFANLFGCITRCLFYAWLGHNLTGGFDYIVSLSEEELEVLIAEGAGDFNIIIFIILGVLILFAVMYNLVLIPYLKKKRKAVLANLEEEKRKTLEKVNKEFAENEIEPN